MDSLEEQLVIAKFDKQLLKLNKRCRNQKIVLYGAGRFFQKVIENYDLSGLNIIGISDKKYKLEDEGKSQFGYKVIPFEKILSYNPDCILVSVVNYILLIEDFKERFSKKRKLKILPLVDRPLWELLKELFD